MRIIKRIIFFCIVISNCLAFAQQQGNASYYSKKLHGHHTSDGGKYHPDSLTCAHLSYPLGTLLKVRNPINNREVIVKVTDRGPHQRRLLIDLSYSAAMQLDIVRAGIAAVEITKLDFLPLKKQDLIPILVSVSEISINLPLAKVAKFLFPVI